MTFHAPQIIWLALTLLALGIALARDGQAVTRKVSFGWQIIALCINGSLLYWGGFFG